MKKTILKLAVFLFCSLMFSAEKIFAQELKLPQMKIKEISGNEIEILNICDTNEIIILSFWATWCLPCINELSAIDTLYSDWQSKYKLKLVAVNVNSALDSQKVIVKVKSLAWRYQILLDAGGALFDSMKCENLPCSFLLNKKGEVLWSHSGYSTGDELKLERKIKELTSK
jgi:cytochrome c biogenesis protein CcmG/thiol:disulfide interchange protein DsbE